MVNFTTYKETQRKHVGINTVGPNTSLKIQTDDLELV